MGPLMLIRNLLENPTRLELEVTAGHETNGCWYFPPENVANIIKKATNDAQTSMSFGSIDITATPRDQPPFQ